MTSLQKDVEQSPQGHLRPHSPCTPNFLGTVLWEGPEFNCFQNNPLKKQFYHNCNQRPAFDRSVSVCMYKNNVLHLNMLVPVLGTGSSYCRNLHQALLTTHSSSLAVRSLKESESDSGSHFFFLIKEFLNYFFDQIFF